MNVPVMDEPSTYALSCGFAIAIRDGRELSRRVMQESRFSISTRNPFKSMMSHPIPFTANDD
jgi:hypothetical protein